MTLPLIAAISVLALLAAIWLSWRLKSAPDHVRVPIMAAFGAALAAMGIAILVFGGPILLVIVGGCALAGRGIGYFAADRLGKTAPRRS